MYCFMYIAVLMFSNYNRAGLCIAELEAYLTADPGALSVTPSLTM